HTDKYMGIVDHLWVPKNAYYLYRKNWAGRDPDYPQNGTAAKIDLIADLTTLRADGADISRLIATIRTAAGVCVNTITPVTLTLNGPATIFGSSTLTTAAGRTGALLRTTTGPGTITVIASAAGLTPDTVRLLSQPVTEDFVAVRKSQAPAAASPLRLDIVASQQWITLAFPRGGAETRLKVINAQGKVVASMVTEKPTMRINRTAMARGLLLFVWNDDRRKITVRRNYINF
ncbi:MAG: hypothetical protein JXA71_15775, partial [Chitinispirillaceae bacterium]|nr:hypothetical protein [Chitinispirillaceae bacterium]